MVLQELLDAAVLIAKVRRRSIESMVRDLDRWYGC